jgi:hypothetical protein
MTLSKLESYTLPEGETDLLIVRLKDLENNSNLIRKPIYTRNGFDFNNSVTYQWSPLAPIQYDVKERRIVPGDMWKDGSGEYSPSITTQFYRLTIAGMANGLIKDLQKRFFDDYKNDLKLISHPDFDILYIVEDNETKQIFASRGKYVLYIGYHGYADIDRIITLAAEKLSIDSR